MAEFEKKKHAKDEFNNGNKYVANDGVQPATINNLVENSLYTEAFAESLASTPDTTKVAQVGTPTVELVDNPSAGVTGAKKFKFSNLKGEQGHGYFRVATTLETTATSVASSYVQWGGATVALASDSIVDNNGNVFAVTTKTAATSPTIPISYRTSIRGTAGADGTDGEDGDSVFVRYSASSNGSNMTATPATNTRYIGFYRGQSASNTASDYTWSQYVGKEISEVAIDEFSFIITYDDGTTSTAPLNTENCLVTYAVSSDEATAMTAYLVPNNADLNDYRGENYWGKTFYAGGNNTVQNTPIAGITFNLEVLRSGTFATTQRITMLAVGSNNQPTVFTRSVSDTTTTGGEGTWTAWTEVAEASGTYPNMTVGKAQESNNNLLLNGDFKLNTQGQSVYVDDGNQYIPCVDDWEFGYGDCTLTVLSSGGLQITKESGEINPSNLQTTDIKNSISAAGKYIIAFKVDALSSVAQIYCHYTTQSGTQYVTLTSNNDTQNNIAIRTFTLTDEQVTAIKQSEKLVVGIQKSSAAESLTVYWAKLEEGSVSTAPSGLVQNATEALYARKANTANGLSKRASITNGVNNNGWYRFATVPLSALNLSSDGSYSCFVLVNGINPFDDNNDALNMKSGLLELDIRITGSAFNYQYSIAPKLLYGSTDVEEFCAVGGTDNVSYYVRLPGSYSRYNFTVIDEIYHNGDTVNALKFETTYVSASAPSGAQYAVVRNIASSANYLTASSFSFPNPRLLVDNTATFDLSGVVDSGLFLAVVEHSLSNYGGYSLFFDASKTTGACCPFVFDSNILENKIMYNASDKTIRIQTGATTNVTMSASLTLYAISII